MATDQWQLPASQKHLFSLDPEHTWISCAARAPLLKSVEAIGLAMVSKRSQPHTYSVDDFFNPLDTLRQNFAQLINAPEPERVVTIPSVSYALANVANNIPLKSGQNIVVVEATFPSIYYTFEALCKKNGAELRTVKMPLSDQRAADWNADVLAAIDDQTAAVVMSNLHWTDGLLFDLFAVREKSRAHGALLIVDGTQSVGVRPMDVQKLQPDALICAGYKWLFGSYGLGVAWFGPAFDNGTPIEQGWMAREHSEDFQNLINYQDEYRAMAGRYSVGESSQFILLPMLARAIQQINDWGPSNILSHCDSITAKAFGQLEELDCTVEPDASRSPHLFGVHLGTTMDADKLQKLLAQEQIYVSLRGSAVRVSPHVHNTEDDLLRLTDCFRRAMR